MTATTSRTVRAQTTDGGRRFGGLRSGRGRSFRVGLSSAVLSIGFILAVWVGFLWFFDVNHFVGKGPLDVWRYLVTADDAGVHRSAIAGDLRTTLRNAGIGLSAGTIGALLTATLFTIVPISERVIMPMAMALRSVPLIATTPLIVLTFGRGLSAVAIIAGIITFLPTLVNVTLALRAAQSELADLIHAFGGSRSQLFTRVQVPTALPALFASLRIASPLAVIGALVAEWLATGKGLGAQILETSAYSDYTGLWSRVVILVLCSVTVYKGIAVVEQRVLRRFALQT